MISMKYPSIYSIKLNLKLTSSPFTGITPTLQFGASDGILHATLIFSDVGVDSKRSPDYLGIIFRKGKFWTPPLFGTILIITIFFDLTVASNTFTD